MRLWNAVACTSVLCGLMALSGCSWTADTPTAVTQEAATNRIEQRYKLLHSTIALVSS